MPSNKRILVVGTTSDYIDWIERNYPATALFLTDPQVRHNAHEPAPPPGTEIVCALTDFRQPRAELTVHLAAHRIQLSGVVSFDCESMALAADLAKHYHLHYPSAQAVDNCRNKHVTKSLWRANGLHAPAVRLVRSADEAASFRREMGGDIVLKPLSGSGSELIFSCSGEAACRQNFTRIREGLEQRAANRLYQPFLAGGQVVLAEELVSGIEYSCDFILERDHAAIIRLTKKIPALNGHFGTTRGYLISPELAGEIDIERLQDTLVKSAQALGLRRSICMLDFMLDAAGEITLLELSPRPGGDCLPALLRVDRGLDIIKLAMDFACREPVQVTAPFGAGKLAGLRLLATAGGRLKGVDTSRLEEDGRVREVCITRRPGHRIELPPQDYDSWCLGHIIFAPEGQEDLQEQCRQLLDLVVVQME